MPRMTESYPNCPLPVTIRRHKKARHMILRLSSSGKELLLTLPGRISEKRGLAFLQSQTQWIETQLAQHKAQKKIAIVPGLRVQLFGQWCTLLHQPGQLGAVYTGAYLIIGGDVSHFSRRVQDWIKIEARKRYLPLATHYASKLGKKVTAVTMRDTRSRWGSCSSDGRLSLCWRLAFAPVDVAHYVVAHEVAHIKHFDHSPAFWRAVAGLHPEWEAAKHWLQLHGKTLHRYE